MAHSVDLASTPVCHAVAVPYPGRGHISPMINLCKLIASRKPDIIITFVVTEEWLTYIVSDPSPPPVGGAIRFATIPNVIPSERIRANDFPGFYESVMTKLEHPFEQLLDHLEPPVAIMIADIELRWPIDLANRRNIPVAALWTSSATFFSMLFRFDLFARNQDSPIDLLENEDHIPGIASSNLKILRTVFRRNDSRVMQLSLECISKVPKAQYLLFTSVYELEAQEMDALRATFPFPVYAIGPAIPYLELQANFSGVNNSSNYKKWLDLQPEDSVLYISFGSFLSVSRTQMDEIVAGLLDSGVPFLWVVRGEASRLKEICSDKGVVLPWCDQLKVLCHSSVGGFWTHCGWNSTMEALLPGVPMLTFPLFWDQDPNSKQILEEWRVGWKVEGEIGEENLVTRKEIAELVQGFMDLERDESKAMRRRTREIRDIYRLAVTEGGSSVKNLDVFIKTILQGNSN